MRFAKVTDLKSALSAHLARAHQKKEPIVVTRHGRPYAIIQPIIEEDLDSLELKCLVETRLSRAWKGEDDGLYDYL